MMLPLLYLLQLVHLDCKEIRMQGSFRLALKSRGFKLLRDINLWFCAPALTLGGGDSETISTRHLADHLPSEGPHEDLNTLVLLEVLHSQLPEFITAEGHQTAALCTIIHTP